MAQQPLNKELFNIDLLLLNKDNLQNMREVSVLDIFSPNSQVFHPDGLFSLETFGQIGSPIRQEMPGYIDLKIPILHPLVYRTILNLKSSYKDIMEGTLKVKFNKSIKDFEVDENGETGYSFFIKHLDELSFTSNSVSEQRNFRVKFVKKYGNTASMFTKWLVMPAGLRDYTVDASGQPKEDEINTLYRKLLSTTTLLKNTKILDNGSNILDNIKLRIQKITLEIYEYIETMLNGKKKFIEGVWASRSVAYGTRNVITGIPTPVLDLDDPVRITFNHTVVGIFQYIKAIAPVAMNRVHNMFIHKVMAPDVDTGYLIDPETMTTKLVPIPAKVRDEWLSQQGLNNIFNKLGQDEIKGDYVKINGYYLAALAEVGNTIHVIFDTEQLPEGITKKDLRPITYVEMVYISILDCIDKFPALTTRYPAIEEGSIYPCKLYVKTTMRARDMTIYINNTTLRAIEYPILTERYYNSFSVHQTHLGRLGGDHDGDSVLGKVYIRYILQDEDSKIHYKYSLMDLSKFPKGKLIESKGNKEIYKVPDNIEILTIWNGDEKWVKPESYSIHKDLKMYAFKTHKGNTVECSDEHSVVTMDKNLSYMRTNPKVGMLVPRKASSVDKYVELNTFLEKNYTNTITNKGTTFKLDNDLGYVFGAIVGDGWVAKYEDNKYAIMLPTNTTSIADAITTLLKKYGYNGSVSQIDPVYKVKGPKYKWRFFPLAHLLYKSIGDDAYNKHLPRWWVNTTPEFRWGVLSGLIDTNGSTYIDPETGIPTLFVTTRSRELAYDMIALANSLGMTAGMSIRKPKNKTNLKYLVTFSNTAIPMLQQELKLLTANKAKTLADMKPKQNHEDDMLTPPVHLDKLLELYYSLSVARKDQEIATVLDIIAQVRVSDVIEIAKSNEDNFGYFTRTNFYKVVEAMPELFEKGFWKEYLDIVNNTEIEWELITELHDLPEVTEAYDLTVPPYCTFVLQNGIIVYDTLNLIILMTEESIAEANRMFNSPTYYVKPSGEIVYSAATDNAVLMMQHLTSEPYHGGPSDLDSVKLD